MTNEIRSIQAVKNGGMLLIIFYIYVNHNPNIEFISHSNIEHIARRKETVGFCVPFSIRL